MQYKKSFYHPGKGENNMREFQSIPSDGLENKELIRYAVESSMVNDLVYKNVVSESTIKSYQEILNLDICPNNVLLINVDDLNPGALVDDRKERFLRAAILKTIKLIVNSKQGIATLGDKGDIVAIIPVDTEADEHEQYDIAMGFSKELLKKFSDKTGLSATIGIGRTYKNFLDIPKSYEEAKKALKHEIFLGSYKAIHINDVIDYDDNVLEFFLEKESELTARVKVADEEGALAVLNELLRETFKQNGIYPDMLKVRILELLTIISRAAIEGGADPRTILELKVKYGNEIENIEKQEEFEEWINKAFKEVISHVKVNQQIEAIRSIRLALNYIDANYMKQITLEDVAGYVHLSVYYFSHMFKKEIGMTFVEYLTEKRMGKAKQLLLTTDLPISDIAREAGYWDSNYFGKVFKSMEGVTASQYRKGAKSKQVKNA